MKEQRRLEEEYARFGRDQPRGLSAGERQRIRALARDLPALWHAATTTAADRQRIVRLLVKEVVVTVRGESERVDVTIHWAGGFPSDHELVRPVQRYQQMADYERLLNRIDELRTEGRTSGRGGRAVESRGLSSAEALGDVHERYPGPFARPARSNGSASPGRGGTGRPG